MLSIMVCCVFFFKQKTAYEMRISDWSSDVCSSDLLDPALAERQRHIGGAVQNDVEHRVERAVAQRLALGDEVAGGVVEQPVDRAVLPGGGQHRVDGRRIADVALEPARPSRKVVVELGRRLLQNVRAPAADDDVRSEEHTSE